MAKLPHPPARLPVLEPGDVRHLALGTLLFRAYRAAGAHPSAWNHMRTFGPTSARFDPHAPPSHEQDRGVLYAAGSLPTAVAEAFGEVRVIERSREQPWIAAFALTATLPLLDLSGEWPTRAGASQAISSGRRDVARLWARAVYEQYPDAMGLVYPSAMSGRRRRRGDPPMHGLAMALFDRGAGALPSHPLLHLPLLHPGLDAALGDIAVRFGYGLVT